MLPSKEQILKTNTGFRELVLSCFGSCVRQEHKRLYPLIPKHYAALEKKKSDDQNNVEPPVNGYTDMLEDHEIRLWSWILKQLKNNDIINSSSPKEAKPHHIEAVLSMFDDSDADDIKYLKQDDENNINYNKYVDFDGSKKIIMDKIIKSEFLYGLAL